jgi:hypothetical protein
MSKRPSNEKVWCFVCERTIPARDAEPVMRGDIVKQACKEHGLGPRLTPPKPDAEPIWTRFTGHCEFCKRDFHLSQQALDDHRAMYPADTEEVAATAFTACMSCAAGRDFAGEHDFSTPKKRPTIIVYMSGALVEDVVSDMDLEVCPFIYTVDFNTAGQDESEYSIELDMPQHSGDNPVMKREDAFCYEWQGRYEPTAIARLEDALARVHQEERAAEAIGDESAVPQHTPINQWRLPPKQDDLSERVERVNVDDLSAFISDLYSEGDGELRDRHLEKLVRYILTESDTPIPQQLEPGHTSHFLPAIDPEQAPDYPEGLLGECDDD